MSPTLSQKFANDFNEQAQCPLFNRTPPEIRNHIFHLTLRSYYDKLAGPYPSETYFTRPEYRYPQRIDTNLLSTCRKVYLEAHLVPILVNEHVFWCYRGPPKSIADPKAYFKRMTDEQRTAVEKVHFFAQMYWLEGSFPTVCALKEMKNLGRASKGPKSLKITIRHSDWWFWERNMRLRIQQHWGNMLVKLKGLEELELELETIERDKDQLNAIVTGMLGWQFKLNEGTVLSTAGTDVLHSRWYGPSSFGTLRYSANEKAWKSMSPRQAQEVPEQRLVYCVTLLTWRPVAQEHH